MGIIWGFLRVAGIVVGIATLLRLATLGFDIEYKEFFQAFLDQVRGIIELGFLVGPLEVFVSGALDWLRGFDLSIPELQAHWKPAFTLTWLLMAALARNEVGNIALKILWGFVCALLAAVAAGTQPLTSWAVVLWPVLGFVTFFVGIGARYALARHIKWREVASVGVAVALFALPGYLVAMALTSWWGLTVDSPQLLTLVCIVAGVGLVFGALGLAAGGRSLRQRLANSGTAISLDILGVMGGALAIGYVMMK